MRCSGCTEQKENCRCKKFVECKCYKTIEKGHACKNCQDFNMLDFNFVSNFIKEFSDD